MIGCPGQELSNSYKEVLVTSALRYVRTQGYMISLTGSQLKRTYILVISVFCLNILFFKKDCFSGIYAKPCRALLSNPGDVCIGLSGCSEG